MPKVDSTQSSQDSFSLFSEGTFGFRCEGGFAELCRAQAGFRLELSDEPKNLILTGWQTAAKSNFLANLGRQLEHRRENLLRRPVGSSRYRIDVRMPALSAPDALFLPSKQLVSLVLLHSITPDAHIIWLEKKLPQAVRAPECDIGRKITEEVEGLFANLARRASANDDRTILISDGSRFNSDVCEELIDRLGLDPYNPRRALDKLHAELDSFLLPSGRTRPWGVISLDGGIKFDIDVQWANDVARLDEADPSLWVVTE